MQHAQSSLDLQGQHMHHYILNDAVEAHSCVDIVANFTDEQYTNINQSTAGRFNLRDFVNCLQISLVSS